jgi:hypothetical protein
VPAGAGVEFGTSRLIRAERLARPKGSTQPIGGIVSTPTTNLG